ncbi:MAG: LD-carboxypeptidase [Gemmatimonadota bacterium]|nr:LD-carboxypeptidase [Gemmatimonadota bacterium]
MHFPPPLAPGARVALVAPAGPLGAKGDLKRAVENALSFGWEVSVGDHVQSRKGYLAGSDAERLADLNAAIQSERVDGIWCIRGGYGAMRLLERVDYASLRRRPKALLGYSDVTALHSALITQCELVSFHAPTARSRLTDFARESLCRAVIDGSDPCGTAERARTLYPGRTRGRLAGGNLSLLAALTGTSYAPDLDGAILVLEDVNEDVYRIDRMLTQLRLSGLLRKCAGIVFGAFTDMPGEPGENIRALDALFEELARDLHIPSFAGAPIGHIDDQWTVPLGAMAELDADAGTLTVDMK